MPMPMIPIYALIAAAIFGAGYTTAWKIEHKQIAMLEASIDTANKQAADILREAAAHESILKAAQEANNVQIETKHAEDIKRLTDNHALNNAGRVWASHQGGCGRAMPKAGDPHYYQSHDVTGHIMDAGQFSEGLNAIIRRADIESADHHQVIQFLNNIPTELVE